MHRCIRTYRQTYRQTDKHTYIHTCIPACIHAYIFPRRAVAGNDNDGRPMKIDWSDNKEVAVKKKYGASAPLIPRGGLRFVRALVRALTTCRACPCAHVCRSSPHTFHFLRRGGEIASFVIIHVDLGHQARRLTSRRRARKLARAARGAKASPSTRELAPNLRSSPAARSARCGGAGVFKRGSHGSY